ncbi:glycoside hydrolase/deacetylase [Anaeromyces robustus]|uniref:Glycoside hydrolase/deacetylase n=1 Tax=Anaeromyces robustus TaxID=1754192 RepID=A0A1Y1XDI0_9FUNG|nr:glycoside hydrolase/deacetylase [Anaeromyces robustus]|eukprot:ORX83424.1 glycoside hydrolase/deacetylase [Anaeromyces robustus]
MFALTFDDGPSLDYTGKVLDVLKKHDVKATFFVNGKNCVDVAQNPTAQELLRREIAEGHVIASHTYTHPEGGITILNDEQLTYEMKTLNDLLFEVVGVTPAFFRPPLGEFNAQNEVVLENLGFTANIIWNLDSNDWKDVKINNATQNYIDKLKHASPEKNSFIALNHDIQKFTATKNLDIVIPIIKEKGYRFVTVDECLGMTAYHNINSLEGNVKQVAQMNKEGLISTTTIPSAVITTPVVTTPTVTVASTVVPGENEQLLTSGSSKVQAFTLTLSMIVSMFAIFNYF